MLLFTAGHCCHDVAVYRFAVVLLLFTAGYCFHVAAVLLLFTAGEMLSAAEPFLGQQMHPTTIIRAFRRALEDILTICRDEMG